MHIQTYRSETVTLLFWGSPWLFAITLALLGAWQFYLSNQEARGFERDLVILTAMSQARKRMEKQRSVQTVAPFPNTLPTVRAVNHYLTGWCCLISHVQGMAGIKKEQAKVLENIPTGNN